MSFTDLFIRRPIIAISLSLLILLAGAWAISILPLGLYPQVTVPVVRIETTMAGASPEVMQNYVTNLIQTNLTGMQGVDYIDSNSAQGDSVIKIYFFLGQDLDQAMSEVMRQVQSVTNQLPTGCQQPQISVGRNDSPSLIYRATSNNPQLEWVTNYLTRMVVPQLQLVNGVSNVKIWGPSYEMDVSLNPQKLIAYQLSAHDIVNAISNYTTPSSPGTTQGVHVNYLLNPETALHSPTDFANLAIKYVNGKPIWLKDVATTLFHDPDENFRAYFNGMRGDAVAIITDPNSNPLTIAKTLYALIPKINMHLPGDLKLTNVFDITKYISASLHEVIQSIIESLLVVVAVMLLLLGSPRTVLIPLSTIPLSLIGVCFIMQLCHFSFNALTLLAMVMAIGLVVDDAIVVVENIVRHIENGETALEASLIGAREIIGPVIAMTLTLAAVYAPMLLAGGITGHLFTEFAMTLASSVLISGLIALTLSPFLCSRLLNQKALHSKWVLQTEQRVGRIRDRYLSALTRLLNYRRTLLGIWLVILVSCGWLYQHTPRELVPVEDTGILQIAGNAPPDVNLNFLERYRPDVEKALNSQSDIINYVEFLNGNTLYGYLMLKNWTQRHLHGKALISALQQQLSKIAGLTFYVSNVSLLPGTHGDNTVSLMLTGSTMDYAALYAQAKKLEQLAMATGKFLYVNDDLQYNQPQINYTIDRAATTAMNLNPADIAHQLTGLLSMQRVTQFNWQGQSYDIQISMPEKFRKNPEDLLNLEVPNQEGKLIPLGSVLHMQLGVVPQELNQFQLKNSVKISAQTKQGTSYSEGLTLLQNLVDTQLTKDIFLDYSGMSRQFLQEGQRTLWIFGMAVIIIFLVLSIQFNRFRDALIILIGSAPLAIFAALIFLFWGHSWWIFGGTINIYTQIGLLTLVGLISKHGILLTQFANEAQLIENTTPLQAILQAARLRFRPIIMTTSAMVVGALPLLFASGAGAESRHAIGLIIVAGMSVGTLFTLFIMPAMYLWLGRKGV